MNDLHRLDLTSLRWTHVAPAGQMAPSPRDRMVAVAWKTDMYIFGGFDGSARTNELWKFDTVRLLWSQIVSDPPSARHSHSAVVKDGRIYVLFGYDGNYRADVHVFDIIRGAWVLLEARGQIPRPRYRSSAVVFADKIFIFGGHDGTRHLDDLFCLDLLTNSWALVDHTTGPICRTPSPSIAGHSRSCPTARDSHTAIVHDARMLVFGGSSGAARNDFWEYRFEQNRWTQIEIEPGIARFCHTAVLFSDRMYIHAGYDGQHRLGDTVSTRVPENLALDCPPSRLMEDLAALVGSQQFADVCFVLDDATRVFAHRVLLSRVDYFSALFSLDMRERDQQELLLPNVAAATFRHLLEFVYTDQFAEPLSPEDAAVVFEAADRFGMDRLKAVCEQTILASINIDNACTILHSADLHASTVLRGKALDFVRRHYDEIVKTKSFELLAKTNVQIVLELIRKQ